MAGRKDQTAKATEGSRCNCTALRKASRRISQLYDTALAPSGLKTTQRAILAVGTGHGRRARGGAGDGFRCARPHAEAAGARQFASPNRSFTLNRGRSEPVNCEPEGFALHLC